MFKNFNWKLFSIRVGFTWAVMLFIFGFVSGFKNFAQDNSKIGYVIHSSTDELGDEVSKLLCMDFVNKFCDKYSERDEDEIISVVQTLVSKGKLDKLIFLNISSPVIEGKKQYAYMYFVLDKKGKFIKYKLDVVSKLEIVIKQIEKENVKE